MGSKRKPDSPLTSEPSPKIRRISIANSDVEETQDEPPIDSPSSPEQAKTEVEPEPASSFYRAPLTKKNLRQLEEMTQSKKSNTVVSDPSSGSNRTSSSNAESKADGKALSTTEQGFEARFLENGYVAPTDLRSKGKRPVDIQDIRSFLDKSRGSASPTNSQHDYYLDEIHVAANEIAVERAYCESIFKNNRKLNDRTYGAYYDKQWVDFEKNVGFNNGLAAPKPDVTEGYRQTAFPPNIKQLGGAATLVKHSPNFVALPHFAAEFKNYGGDMRKADVQAAYDGAAMVHAHNKALQLIGEPDPPGHTAALTMTSDGRGWTIWAHHAEKDEATQRMDHFQSEVKSGRTIDFDDFKRTYKMNRNAQDWGRKESTELRDRLQQHYDLHGIVPTGSAAASAASKSRAASTSSKQSAVNAAVMKNTSTPSQRTSNAGNKGGDNPKPLPVQKAIPSAPPSVASSGKGSVHSSGPSTASRVAPNAPADKSKSNNSGEISMPPGSRKAVPRSSPKDLSNASAKLGAKQKVQVESKPMPPPPSKINGTPSKRDEGSKLLNGNKDTGPRRTSIDSSRSSEARPDTLTPTRAPVASDVAKQVASDREKSNREKDDRRRYRDREYGIQQLQYRRSDSPDRHREPRPQDKNREPRLRDMVRDICCSAGGKDDRSERSSASGSSSSSTNSNNKLPSKPSFVQPVKTRPEPVKRPEYGESEQFHAPTSDALYGRRW